MALPRVWCYTRRSPGWWCQPSGGEGDSGGGCCSGTATAKYGGRNLRWAATGRRRRRAPDDDDRDRGWNGRHDGAPGAARSQKKEGEDRC
ncbi:pollen-specific leucine-rich repeat extensin-like protein 4 [Iris pallida]|uniref:Pollen-specific leucine-rich repeat extensin-like protein 4 n=1 Tax=Iris pallida TaxID=29817 RepID=A0AAX6FFR1_IRIPA|nr:pollen-specific leucine-rich repeat extensin-like protein 4 [Iris pallida]